MDDETPEIRYLNTDLDLASKGDLSELSNALEAQDFVALHVGQEKDNSWSATFETSNIHEEPESNIREMLDVIEALEESARMAWDECAQREFNIDYDCGDKPRAFNQGISHETVRRMGSVGASLRVTLYPQIDESTKTEAFKNASD